MAPGTLEMGGYRGRRGPYIPSLADYRFYDVKFFGKINILLGNNTVKQYSFIYCESFGVIIIIINVKFSHTRYQASGSRADPCVRTVSPRVTKSSPAVRLSLLSARPVVTFPAEERHRPTTSTKLYCLVTEAHRCEQSAQSCCAALPR